MSFANTSNLFVLISKYDTNINPEPSQKKILLNQLEILNTLKQVIGICNETASR